MSVEWQSIKTFVEKSRISMIFVDFATLSLATHVSLRVRTRLGESQEVDQEIGGGRSDRFRARTHVLSGPG